MIQSAGQSGGREGGVAFRWALEVSDECEDALDDDLLDRDDWAVATADGEDSQPTETWPWPRLRAYSSDGERGIVTVIGDELLWGLVGDQLPSKRIPLINVVAADVMKRANPFQKDVLCVTLRDKSTVTFGSEWSVSVEHEMLPNLMLASPILLDTWILSLVPTTSMVESVGLASVVPGSAVPETCSVMGRHVGAGAQAWADGWAQGMEGEKHGCCMRWVGT